jgi:hypothetical protein
MNTKLFRVEARSMNGKIESRTNYLSFAILIVDSYTKDQPVGNLTFYINNEILQPMKNNSGYYLFLNLCGDNYCLQINSEFYFDKSLDVQLSSLNPLNPLIQVELIPTPTYPFSSGATLIRGMVLDSSKRPVSNAIVKINEKKIESFTSQKGEFVLYFPSLKKDEIIKENNKRYVKTANGKRICISSSSGKEAGKVTLDGVEEGVSNSVKYILLR